MTLENDVVVTRDVVPMLAAIGLVRLRGEAYRAVARFTADEPGDGSSIELLGHMLRSTGNAIGSHLYSQMVCDAEAASKADGREGQMSTKAVRDAAAAAHRDLDCDNSSLAVKGGLVAKVRHARQQVFMAADSRIDDTRAKSSLLLRDVTGGSGAALNRCSARVMDAAIDAAEQVRQNRTTRAWADPAADCRVGATTTLDRSSSFVVLNRTSEILIGGSERAHGLTTPRAAVKATVTEEAPKAGRSVYNAVFIIPKARTLKSRSFDSACSTVAWQVRERLFHVQRAEDFWAYHDTLTSSARALVNRNAVNLPLAADHRRRVNGAVNAVVEFIPTCMVSAGIYNWKSHERLLKRHVQGGLVDAAAAGKYVDYSARHPVMFDKEQRILVEARSQVRGQRVWFPLLELFTRGRVARPTPSE